MNLSVPRRSHSPLAIVNALALTIAALLTAWDAGCHGHEASAATNAWCTIDHEAEATGATNHATLGKASTLHEHFCVACRTGGSRPNEAGRASVARLLDVVSAATRPANDGSARRGDPRQQAARGPPPG